MPSDVETAIFWFRQDFRLKDNLALSDACQSGLPLLMIYILDTSTPRRIGAAQCWWLHHSLEALSQQLKEQGHKLHLLKGNPKEIIKQLSKKNKTKAVFWNRCYDPYAIERDMAIKADLENDGVEVVSKNAMLLHEPGQFFNQSGGYFKVFTPFWKSLYQNMVRRDIVKQPVLKKVSTVKAQSDKLKDWALLPEKPNWAKGFAQYWTPGEKGAQKRLKAFLNDNFEHYGSSRDRPEPTATSQLSPHLHFGEISPYQVMYAAEDMLYQNPKISKEGEMYIRQLGWREFSYYLLFHADNLLDNNFNDKFDNFKWRKDKKQLNKWQKGQTGIPIVDAGMRELWHTGYMHNRVRMIVASLLTKNCLIHWKEGESWFWDTLLDADLANNVAGWQWVQGCGADASPYFRIFNPVLQGDKFDLQHAYVKRWVPEIKELPDKFIQKPWDAPDDILKEAGITLGKDYPKPMLDLKATRDRALESYKQIKK